MKTILIRPLEVLCVLYVLCGSIAIAQETEVRYLSGHGKDDAVPWKFSCSSGANSGVWTNLPVPSQWDMHGFGTLNYHRDLSNAYDERGRYETEFSVPPNWRDKRIFLVFDGVMTDTSAKLNGQSAGETHQGGFYRFKYEVTKLAKFGAENKLEVEVAKHSTNSTVNRAERNADYWVFGGIYRPVRLEAVPRQFIDRVAIDAKADGSFSAKVFFNGLTNAWETEAQIQTLDGENVGKPFIAGITAAGMGDYCAVLRTQIWSPKLWTAETPNLYRVQIRLKQNGKTIHEISQRFGFRTFEVRDGDGLYLNGKKIILRGVCRHSFWPDSGRTLSEAVHRLDIQTIKDMNGNAVRMSHYPPDAEFLDLCDELGIYVLDELAGWHAYYDTPTGTRLVGEMVTRDVNHPSILFWDNGNEGGFNTNLDKVFGKFDPQQRRVLHPWATFNGLCTAHYLAYDKANIAAGGQSVYYARNQERVATNDAKKYIYMPTEFQHGLFDGGAGAALDDYWRMMMSHPNCAGGFIWAFTDDAVIRPDTGAIDTASNQAPDGIVGPYRQREGSFYAIKQIWSPIQITPATNGIFYFNKNYELKLQTNGVFRIENNYKFTDAGECKFEWELRKFSKPDQKGDFKILAKGKIAAPSIPPGRTGWLRLHLPDAKKKADALALRVTGPDGRELWTWVFPLRTITTPATQSGVYHVMAWPDYSGGTTGSVTELKAKGIVARIEDGKLISVERDGKKFSLANGPRIAATNSVLKNVSWQLRDDGWLKCDFTYTAEGTNDFLGVAFDYPTNLVKSKRWLGDGPFRVWKNRLQGVTLGVWQNDYNSTITGWRDWIYPEFKGAFANVRWLQLETTEGQITVVPENVPFVQVFTPDLPPAKAVGKTVGPLPDCGLGLLHAIPAVGSKFKTALDLGPSSQPTVAHGEYSGSVSFYFGKLP